MNRSIALFTLSLLIWTGISQEATAVQSAGRRSEEQDAALLAQKRGDILAYNVMKAQAERVLSAQIVSAKLKETTKGWLYEIRARQENGRVIVALFDAKTGRLVEKPKG